MSTDFRALCAELADSLEQLHKQSVTLSHTQVVELSNGRHPIPLGNDLLLQDHLTGDILARARAALAAEAQGPSDDELNTLWNCCGTADEYGHHEGNIFEYARAVLARYGTTPPRPVPVADPSENVRYEFSVFNGEDEWQAGGEAPTLEQAQREGWRYLAHYEADEDGPYRLELREVRVLPAHSIPTPEAIK